MAELEEKWQKRVKKGRANKNYRNEEDYQEDLTELTDKAISRGKRDRARGRNRR